MVPLSHPCAIDPSFPAVPVPLHDNLYLSMLLLALLTVHLIEKLSRACEKSTTMTSLLPPNLLRLFAPRDPVPYLRPLTKDDADRGPNKLGGVGSLVTRLKEEADAEEIKKGLDDTVVTQSETSAQAQAVKDQVASNGDAGAVKQENDTAGSAAAPEAAAAGSSKAKNSKGKARKDVKPKRLDKIAKLGVVGQEARKMRVEERKKRQEKYKKDQEKNCTFPRIIAVSAKRAKPGLELTPGR